MGLFSLYLAALAPLSTRFADTPTAAALGGGLLLLFSRNSVYHYVWLTDGVHALQGLAFVAAARLMLRGLDSGSRRWLALSGATLLAGSLVREDTLVLVPILPLLGLFSRGSRPRLDEARELAVYAAGLAAASLALIGYRRLVVPQAPPPSVCLGGVLQRLLHLMNPVGNQFFDLASLVLGLGAWLILAGIGVWAVLRRRQLRWPAPAVWLGCAVIGCCANTEFQRDDLLFFAASFLSLAYATLLVQLAERPRPSRAAAVACGAWLLLGGAYTGRALAENFHPDSTVALAWNGQFIYGWARHAHVPSARAEPIERRMAAVGIHDRGELRRRLPRLAAEAQAQGRRSPGPDGRLFYPRLALPPDVF